MSARPVEQQPEVRMVVFSDAFQHRNGVGAYYCDLLDQLASRVAHAVLVCPGTTPEGKPQGLSIPLPGDRTQKLCLPGLSKAVRTMRTARPNVVVLATPGPYGILGLLLALFFGVRVCVGYHTQFDKLASMYWSRVSGWVGARYLAMLDRAFFRLGRVVVTNSGPMRDCANRMGARDARLVGTPLEPRLLSPPVARASQDFGPVLFVGRLAPEKNLEAVVAAARALPDTSFVIAGHGPLTEYVQAAAAELDNIDYRGWLNRPALLEVLNECETLVVPSHVESFGTVAMEAMARQRIVVVSEHCGIRDWPELAPGLETIRGSETLTDTLRRILAWTAEARAERARRARVCAERFNESTIEQWLEVLRAASSGKPDALRGATEAEALR